MLFLCHPNWAVAVRVTYLVHHSTTFASYVYSVVFVHVSLIFTSIELFWQNCLLAYNVSSFEIAENNQHSGLLGIIVLNWAIQK